MKNDIIEKFIKKAFAPNKLTFENWAAKNGIDITPRVTAKQKFTRRFILRFASVAASVILLTSIILGVVLSGVLTSPPITDNPSLRVFLYEDAVSQMITLDYLYQVDYLLMFNREQILNTDDELNIFREVVRYEEDFILSFTAAPLWFVTSNEENAFIINFRARVHRYFKFFGYDGFYNFTQNFRINNINIYFEILYNNQAYVRFEHNNIEYFLIIDCFFEENITCDTLTMLLSELIR